MFGQARWLSVYCTVAELPRERVFDPGVDSHSTSVFPLSVNHLFLLSVSLSSHFFLSCFSYSPCTSVFLFVYPTVSIPLSHLHRQLPKEIPISLTQTEKGTDTVKTPRSPAKGATRFSREKLTKNFFSFSAFFLLSLSSFIEPVFLQIFFLPLSLQYLI